jgi:hypothetical protein
MRTAPVTGHATDGRDCRAFIVFVETKIFLVDFSGHIVHMTGDIFFRFGVAGEVEVMIAAIGRRGMTKVAFNAQCGFPAIHDLVQIIMADILRKYFQVSLFGLVIVLGPDGGHSGCHQRKQAGNNCNFFIMQHMEIFGPPS